jgi:ferredoxin
VAKVLRGAVTHDPDAPTRSARWAGGRTSSLVFAFLNYLPYGKHFHVITALPNVLCADLDPPGRLAPDGRKPRRAHGEDGRRDGAPRPHRRAHRRGHLEHFSWKSMLDFYTCTECGRCSDNCPAHTTGKLLSPKHLTIDLRDHGLREAGRGLPATGRARGSLSFLRTQRATQRRSPPKKPIIAVDLVPDVIHPDVSGRAPRAARARSSAR